MRIWKVTEGERHVLTIHETLVRMVESQSYIATRRLVDSNEEQKILEAELEKSKPPCPVTNARGRLHWLLFTPFRYPPLQGGGRFHTRAEQSLFYGAKELETAMAEAAYKRFVFRANTTADIKDTHIRYTSFRVEIKTDKGIDLTLPPFKQYTHLISNPLSHAESQPLGSAMRNAGIEAFLFFSARVQHRQNCGVMSVEAFAHNNPLDSHGWVVFDAETKMEFRRDVPMCRDGTKVFHREEFLIGGSLPLFT